MSNFEKFKEYLESKEKFCCSLTDKTNSYKKYDHVLKVWNKFEIKTMKDYRNLYLKCDVLLLADVFEKFRNNNLNNYGLCPSHYLSAPALNWDAMFDMTNFKLKLIPDPGMYIFLGKETRSGVFLEDVLKECLEDVLKACLEDALKICLENILKACLEDVLKTCLKGIFKTCLEDVLKICLKNVLKTYLEDVLKMS